MSGLEIPIVLGAVSAAGTVVQTISGIQSGLDKAEALNKDAQAKRSQVQEMYERELINEGIMREQGERTILQYGAYGGGRTDATLGGIIRMKGNLEQNIALSRRDMEYKKKVIESGADISTDLASDAATTGYLTGFGSLLSGAVQTGERFYKYSAPTNAEKLGSN